MTKKKNVYSDFSTISGSMVFLENIVKYNQINITLTEIIDTIFLYTDRLEDLQKKVFKAYFMRQASVSNLQEMYGFNSVEQAEEILCSALNSYIEALKQDYGIK